MRYIAFLRAINVGGHVVRMEALRGHFAKLGFSKVETFIASGNVIFDSSSRSGPALEKKIAAHLEKVLGYAVATFVRTPAEVAAAAGFEPFPEMDVEAEGPVYVAFLAEEPAAAAVKKLMALATESDQFHVRGREAYWLARKKISESDFSGAKLEKTLGTAATIRNTTTVRKLAGLYA